MERIRIGRILRKSGGDGWRERTEVAAVLIEGRNGLESKKLVGSEYSGVEINED
jgi:hypothetical protein